MRKQYFIVVLITGLFIFGCSSSANRSIIDATDQKDNIVDSLDNSGDEQNSHDNPDINSHQDASDSEINRDVSVDLKEDKDTVVDSESDPGFTDVMDVKDSIDNGALDVKQDYVQDIVDDADKDTFDAEPDVSIDIASDLEDTADIIEDVDNTHPVIKLIKGIPPYTNDNTPDIVFSSTEPGRIIYSGPCKGNLKRAKTGKNRVTYNKLQDGTYFSCSIVVVDDAGNRSNLLSIPLFVVDTIPPEPPEIINPPKITRETYIQVDVRGEHDTSIIYKGQVVGTLDSHGKGQAKVGPLIDGDLNISLRLKDRAGNIGDPATFKVYRYSHLKECEEDYIPGKINNLFSKLKNSLTNLAVKSNSKPYNLYNLQLYTSPFLRYAINNKHTNLIVSLAKIYEKALDTLTYTNKYKFYYFPGDSQSPSTHTLDKTYPMWLEPSNKTESVLVSAQFLFPITKIIYYTATLKPDNRPAELVDFVNKFLPVVLSHYHRWVMGVKVDGTLNSKGPFQVRGWGCKYENHYVPGGINHYWFTRRKLNKTLGDGASPKYCNAVLDSDLWIYAGVANVMMAHVIDSTLVSIPKKTFDFYKDYLQFASKLIMKRTTYEYCNAGHGVIVKCAFFDRGIWDKYKDYAYSGYTGSEFPEPEDKKAAHNVGWDVSHARRFVDVFETLMKATPILGLDGPKRSTLKAYAAKVYHRVFLGDLEYPLFANYMDGTNGWYRVGYSNREGFGYGPSDLSVAFLTGGYPAWIEYYLPLKSVFEHLYQKLISNDFFISEHYEYCYWSDYDRHRCFDMDSPLSTNTMLYLFMFYSGICF